MRLSRAVPLVALAAALAACSTPAPPADPAGTPADGPPGAAATAGYPLTIENCGTTVVVDAPPERVLTVKSSTVDLMAALGVADRVVGAAFLDGPLPSGVDVPVVSDRAPGPEAVLDAAPDLVFAGWESVFSADGAGERATLADLGVLTYVAPAACKGEHMPDPLTFETVFDHVREAGDLFGVPEAAAELVDRQRAALDAVPVDDRGLTALWYSSGSDVPYVGAGIGAPQMLLDAVGLENIAGDVHDTWTSFSWEEVAAADPDVVVLVDSAWNTAEQKIAVLEGNPAVSRLDAVREGRYLVVPFAATEAGVRNVDAAASLADQLAELP